MTRPNKSNSALVPLGTATKVTRGNWGPYSDERLMQLHPGLSRD